MTTRISCLHNNLMRGSVKPLIYGRHANPWGVFCGSAQLKNIATNSSGGGTVGDGGFFLFLEILEMTEDG